MPIKGLSEARRFPRLGKIHTGIKKANAEGKEYPVAVDWFVFPEDKLAQVEAVYGTKQPKQLPILIPLEDEERWCNQYYRAYSQTRGLICKGDGEYANRLVDTGSSVEMTEITCLGQECAEYVAKKCKRMMMLQFLLPDMDGLGVWQLDTGSGNAILNINSAADLIRIIHGHVAMIPLFLTLEYQAVKTPEGKQRTMPILNIRITGTLRDFVEAKDFIQLPAGDVEDVDESYPDRIAQDAQAPPGEEPDPEIDMPETQIGKPEVEMPRAITGDQLIEETKALLRLHGYRGIRAAAVKLSQILSPKKCLARQAEFEQFLKDMKPEDHGIVRAVLEAADRILHLTAVNVENPIPFEDIEPVPLDCPELINWMGQYVGNPATTICEVLGIKEITTVTVPDMLAAKSVLEAYIEEKGLQPRGSSNDRLDL